MPKLRGRQIRDIAVVSEDEAGATYKSTLIADSSKFPLSISDVDSGTKTVTVSSTDLTELELISGDVIEITNSDGADGTYTVDAVTGENTFTVNESIADATSGDLDAYMPTGATLVGVDNRSWVKITGSTVQAALDSVDTQIDNKVDATEHKNLDQLVHGLAEDSFTEIVRDGEYVTRETVWQSASQNTKIREYTYTWSNGLLQQATVTQYDSNGNATKTVTRDYTRDNENVVSYTDTVS
jgi:hypothetical protein